MIPNAAYTIEMINMSGAGSLEVHDIATFMDPSPCTSDQSANVSEVCPVFANGSGAVYILALPGSGFDSGVGASYRLQVK